ncbi:MAG: TonB-dependent receptor [Candidatus Marinimicrobia bacterium]|nr:TonB-dependent receptor [Candidatus Neomarinimicrobiota bacterium]
MNLLYRLLSILILGGTLAAQSGLVSGKITDGSTGLPLVGANVIIKESNRGVASDLEGLFSMELLEGQYEIVASMIGYAPIDQKVMISRGALTRLSLGLQPVVIKSKQLVTIQGNRDDILSHLQETNISTTEHMISLIEGVNLISRGSYAQEPIIRGMSGGRMNITIDGMKSFGACTDRMDPISSYVEADALNSIEVGKGALSILHGSTVGGSLNLTFIKPQYANIGQTIWRIKGGLDTRSQERKFSFSGGRQLPGSAWSLNGSYRNAGDYSDANDEVVPYSGFEKMNFHLGYKKRIDESNQVYAELITDDAYDIGYTSLPMDVGYARLRMLGLSLHSTGISPALLKLAWKVYGNAIDHWMDDSKREDLFMNMHMDMPGFTRTAGSFVDLYFNHSQNAWLKFRSEFYWTSSYADMVMYPEDSNEMKMVTWPAVKRWNFGQFVEYQRDLNSKTQVNTSIRYDFFTSKATDEMGINELHIYYPENDLSRQDHLFSANWYLAYDVNAVWQSVLMLASGSRTPTVSEAYGYYLYNPIDGYLYLGNPDLPTETSKQLEWQNRLKLVSSIINMNLYHYQFKHFTFGQVMPGESLGYARGWKKYVDAGQAMISGAELSVLHQLSSHWTFQGGLNYEVGSLIDFEDNLPLIPPLEAHGSFKFDHDKFWIQIDAKGASSQERFSELSGENQTSGYLVFNLRGEIDPLEGILISVGLNNLTNQLYYEHLDWGDIYRPGRSFTFSLALDQSAL